MPADLPVIEYIHFMNWLQNNRPALYTEYWKIIEPADDHSSLQVKQPVMNDAILKKLEQVTGEYLSHLRSN
jgi:hypothetical protein